MRLDQLSLQTPARVVAVDWSAMPAHEAHRLRALGLDVGATVEALHRGTLFARDPVAVRIGRMTVAMRRRHALAIECERQESEIAPMDSANTAPVEVAPGAAPGLAPDTPLDSPRDTPPNTSADRPADEPVDAAMAAPATPPPRVPVR